MTTPLLQQSPDYAALLRRYTELNTIKVVTGKLSARGEASLATMKEMLDAIELTQYAVLLRRWAELCDKRDDDGLRRSEAAELFRLHGQMDKLERQNSEQVKEK